MGKRKPTQVDLEELIEKKAAERGYDIDGQFHPDPTPVAPPIGFVEQPSMWDRVREMVKSAQVREAALAAGEETFEEADDFEIGDDYDPHSPFEEFFEGMTAAEVLDPKRKAYFEAYNKAVEEARAAAGGPAPKAEAPPAPPPDPAPAPSK